MMLMAQTKKIAFKSHSGSAENFSIALENELFDMENSNFGMAPTEMIRHAQLDSVIFICDTVAIMVTSQYCTRVLRHSKEQMGQPFLWQPGKAEVKNHPLFSKQHSLDSIKKVIRTQYNFRNPVDKVVFIGYDNNKDQPCKKQKPDYVRGAIGTGFKNDPPADGTGGLIFAGILTASLLGGLLSWQLYRRRERKEQGLVWARA
jgi:maltoporin